MELHNFTKAQAKAITHKAGPLLVLAGPGSGKTSTLVGRVRYLIEELKVPSDQILVITFTKAAAIEMEQRFFRDIEGRGDGVTFGTMHSVFLHVLQEEGLMNQSGIIDSGWQVQLVTNAMKMLNERLKREERLGFEPEIINRVLGYISCRKNGADARHILSEQLGLSEEHLDFLYLQYQKNCRSVGRIDYDDMLLLALELFDTKEPVRRRWQKRYQYLLVDEVQDCNQVQLKLIKHLANVKHQDAHSHCMLVGDDDQSLYRFRGATPEWMQTFDQQFFGGEKHYLLENFRSGETIVAHATRLISHNRIRISKQQTATRGVLGSVCYTVYENESLQAERISERIEQIGETEAYDQCAVLFRSRIEMGLMIEALEMRGIPCFSPGRQKNSKEMEIERDMLAYVKASMGTADLSTWLRIINQPYRNIPRDIFLEPEFEQMLKHRYPGHVVVAKLRKRMEERRLISRGDYGDKTLERFETYMKLLANLRPYAALILVWKALRYQEAVEEKKYLVTEEGRQQFEYFLQQSEAYASLPQWVEAMERRLIGSEHMEDLSGREGHVHVMTYHAAKGLEFAHVFLPDANEGLTPHKKAVDSTDFEEERRMFYVAMTRAKDVLYISHLKQYRKKRIAESRFVSESR